MREGAAFPQGSVGQVTDGAGYVRSFWHYWPDRRRGQGLSNGLGSKRRRSILVGHLGLKAPPRNNCHFAGQVDGQLHTVALDRQVNFRAIGDHGAVQCTLDRCP